MKLSICVAVMGQLEDTKGAWGSLIANTIGKEDVELVVIDNGSTDKTGEFLDRFVLPHFPTHQLVRHEENIGVVPSLQEMYQVSRGEILVIPHNDLDILEHGWNTRVAQEFDQDPELGLSGFFGSLGIGRDGGRIGCYSNLLEAELHGTREPGVRPVIGFDGLCLIPRRAMLDQIGGFDTSFSYHHFYDKDLSLAAYVAGWKAKLIGVFCHHRSGVTAMRPDYQAWASGKLGVPLGQGDSEIYKKSEQRFFDKYRHLLPVRLPDYG